MARAESGIHLDIGGIVRNESAIFRIQTVYDDAVLTQIRHISETIPGVRVYRVSVRLVLSPWIHARPLVLDKVGGGRETAVVLDWQRAHAPAVIVGGENEAPCRVNFHVARAGAARPLAVDVRQRPRISIDSVRVHSSLVPPGEFMDFRRCV